IPGRRNLDLPSTPAPKGWLKTVPPNPGPEPKKDDGFWGSIKNTVKKGIGAAHDFMQDHSKDLGWTGVGLGVIAIASPVGWLAATATVAGLVLAAATTADACISSQWGSCALGVTSFGLAGGAVALSKSATSLLRNSSGPFGRQVVNAAIAGGAHGVSKIADASSIGFTAIGTLTGGYLKSPRRDDY
ncbi:hypothetical protein, partial [Streptomyces cadmiisoli]|uniref:hypothetical protein n=1 Tax=Streptomyces cadmiisoli TaxID=2184053 RepID=UPI003D70C26E